MHHPFSDERYYFDFSTFRRHYKNTNEIDFLNYKIKLFEGIILEKKRITDLDIKLKVESDLVDFVNDKRYQEYFEIQFERECKLINREGHIRKAESFIKYYKEKLKLKKLLSDDEVKEPIKEVNPHPDIFKDFESFQIFKKNIEFGLIVPYKDLSFLFQKLKVEKRLFGITHLDFAKWMLDNEFIKKKNYDTIVNKKGFDNKSSSDERLNRYNNIVKNLK